MIRALQALDTIRSFTVDHKATLIEQLSNAALRDVSSPKILERGTTYAHSGAVRILSEDLEPVPTIHAEVDGTATYATRVWIDGTVDGSCDCPNAGDGWFCKHQVAVALVWRHRLEGVEPLLDEAARKKVQASAKRAATARGRREALETFLRSLPAPVLAEKLLELADGYREIERELRTWQKVSDAHARPEDRKALISETLAVGRQFLDWREVGSWVRQAEAILPLLHQERARNPQAALALSLHALRRVWATMERADDSNGEIGGFCCAIAGEWIAALQASGPQPASFGDTYLRLQLDDPFGSYDAAAAELAMGAAALGRYRRLLEREWRKAKDTMLAKRAQRSDRHAAAEQFADDDGRLRVRTLERLHLEQLERAGDVDAMLSVLREDLAQPHRFATITALLEKHNRLREAFANAEKACKAFPRDRQLQEDLLRAYERDGWTDEAYALRRKQFHEEPSVRAFHLVLEAGRAAGRDVAGVRDELLNLLEAREVEAMRSDPPRLPFRRRQRDSSPARQNVSLRAAVLCSEQRWTEACDLVQPPAVCDPRVLREIALNLADSERERAVALLLRVFDQAMRTAQTPYREELTLVREIATRLDPDRRSAWLANLRGQFKAKRNFVRGLPQS
jgi:hypothetical protein